MRCDKLALLVVVIAFWTAHLPVSVRAASPLSKEDKVKLAYLYNFARYVNWPSEAFGQDSGDFIIGVVGKDSFGRSLDLLAAKRKVNNRAMEIRRFESLHEVGHCHLLFVPQTAAHDLEQLQVNHGKPILIVSESYSVLQYGGTISFFNDANGTIGFTINIDAVNRQHLSIRAQVLQLANVVRDSQVGLPAGAAN